jgi:ACS family hexuronate transporter-like MFS transporter
MATHTSTQLPNKTPSVVAPELVSTKMSGYRWKICALLFFATTLNYMDRQVLALLKPTLQDPVRGIGLTEVQFAAIVSSFSAAYALGLLLAGRFIDKVGTRIGYAVAHHLDLRLNRAFSRWNPVRHRTAAYTSR